MHSPLPRAHDASTLAMWTCAFGGAIASIAIAGAIGQHLLNDHPEGVLVIALLTAVFSAALVAACSRTSPGFLIPFGAVAGGMVSAIALTVVCREQILSEAQRATSIEDIVAPVVVCGVVAAMIGAYVGFLFSLAYMIPFGIAAHHDSKATRDGRGRTGIACAIWLALVSIGSMPFAPASDTWHVGVASGVAGLVVSVLLAAYAAPRIDKVAPAMTWPTSPYRAPAL
jgi:hypothetical protein